MKRPQRKMVSAAQHTCPVCGRWVRLQRSGRLFTHRLQPCLDAPPCEGSNGRPQAEVGMRGVADAHFAAVDRSMEREGDQP
jgi:hypothetical protein